ncbi:MAG: recombination regulator RecX, partial [Oscillospiraceae bacterium]|nr:recombination regulator RecX [Oscillospiraceae bacterium]
PSRLAADRQNASVREAALRLLGRRAYGARELLDRLVERGFSEKRACEAVEWLLSLGYLDDSRYAEALVQSYAARSCGPHRIRRELRRRGVDTETAEAALMQAPPPEEVIDAFLARLPQDRPLDDNQRRWAADTLYRKGFDWDDIHAGLLRLADEGERLS